MNPETTAKLARISNRRTRYELVATDGAQTLHAGYCGKGFPSILKMVNLHHEAWAKLTGADRYSYTKAGLVMGAWTLRHSGRTQRDAILGGELPWFKTAIPA